MNAEDMDRALTEDIRRYGQKLSGTMADYDIILKAAADKTFILIGTTTHGTKEFYRARAEITGQLIQEMGFDAVAIEADWQGSYRLNQFVISNSNESANIALSDFNQFPTWLWRNKEILNFIEWLRSYNEVYRKPGNSETHPAEIYGIDLYGIKASIKALLSYLDRVDPAAARRARRRYASLDNLMKTPPAQNNLWNFGLTLSRENDAAMQCVELRDRASEYIRNHDGISEEDHFRAEQCANLIYRAEEYYHSVLNGHPDSWNVRNKHMFETLENLANHISQQRNRPARIVVWAHNAHIGNARATEMHNRGEFNMGQLIKSAYKDKALLIGFLNSCGTVYASDNWNTAPDVKKLNPPFPGSYEELFYKVRNHAFLIDLRQNNRAVAGLLTPRLQRSIGVIYRPRTERYSHYIMACLPEQFDFVFHFDEATAIDPLPTHVHKHYSEFYETYPSGL